MRDVTMYTFREGAILLKLCREIEQLKGQCHRFLSNSNPRKFCPKLKKNEYKHKIKQ
jgi:hypothetical protein